MAVSERRDIRRMNRTHLVLLALGLLGVVLVVLVAAAILNRPPQMGADEEVFHTVDALYTAVRMRDETRVTQCEQRLHSYREAGKLPPEAAEYLDGVIATARAGRWESAAEQLYEFMKVQRREGAADHRSVQKKGARNNGP